MGGLAAVKDEEEQLSFFEGTKIDINVVSLEKAKSICPVPLAKDQHVQGRWAGTVKEIRFFDDKGIYTRLHVVEVLEIVVDEYFPTDTKE
jgi:hypothetical protein